MNILRFVAILGLLALSCFAAPGDLDLSFGGTGKVLTDRTDPSGSSNYAFCMALQSDGKIVVAGENFDMVRYFSNGSLDAGFGNGGRISNGYNASAGLGIKVQADGKIVVAGYASGNFRVIRYNPTGTVDGSFNAASIDFGTTDDYATDLAIVSGGKIVVAGVTGTNAAANFALARLNANGSLDTTFGTAGKVTADFAGNDDEAGSMVVQPDGKIIVAGFAWVGSNRDFAAVRYNIDGSLDPSFGVGGKVTTPIGQSDDYGGAVALQSDGKIVLAGKATKVNSYADLAAVRYNPNGSLDNSFGTGGKVITTVSTFNDSGASDVLIQPDGKIVVVGPTGFGTNSDFTVVRYQMNGALDTGFGIGGKVLTGMGSDDPPQGAALQSDGKIVVAGYSYQSATSYDIAVVRYLGDGPAGGTFTVMPPLPVAVDTMLTATFAGWTSATLPLSYEVRSGTTVLVPAGSNATPSFVLAQGTYVLKGRVYDGAGNFTDTPPVTYQVANPEIVVEQPVGSNLVDGGANVSFGSVLVGASANLVFTIKNSGVSALLGLDVTVDGADAAMVHRHRAPCRQRERQRDYDVYGALCSHQRATENCGAAHREQRCR